MALFVQLRYCLGTCASFTLLALCGILSTPLACVFALLGRRFEVFSLVTGSLFSRLAGWALGLRVEFEGAEHLSTQPAMYMLNHQSAVDA